MQTPEAGGVTVHFAGGRPGHSIFRWGLRPGAHGEAKDFYSKPPPEVKKVNATSWGILYDPRFPPSRGGHLVPLVVVSDDPNWGELRGCDPLQIPLAKLVQHQESKKGG